MLAYIYRICLLQLMHLIDLAPFSELESPYLTVFLDFLDGPELELGPGGLCPKYFV